MHGPRPSEASASSGMDTNPLGGEVQSGSEEPICVYRPLLSEAIAWWDNELTAQEVARQRQAGRLSNRLAPMVFNITVVPVPPGIGRGVLFAVGNACSAPPLPSITRRSKTTANAELGRLIDRLPLWRRQVQIGSVSIPAECFPTKTRLMHHRVDVFIAAMKIMGRPWLRTGGDQICRAADLQRLEEIGK